MATRYWVGGTGNWNDTAHWSTVTGPAGDPPQSVPIAGDDVYFDANSGAGACTINVAAACATITINLSTFTLLHNAGSTLTGAMTLTTGTLNTNGKTCSWGSFSSNSGSARTLTMGSSAITLSGSSTCWNSGIVTNFTMTANTATITMTGSSNLFSSGAKNFNGLSLVWTGGGAAQSLPNSACTFANVTVMGTTSKTDVWWNQGTNTITGSLTLTGAAANSRLFAFSGILGAPQTLVLTGATVTITNTTFCDLTFSGLAATVSGNSIGNAGGNSDTAGSTTWATLIGTTPAKNCYWVGGTGEWSDSVAHWAATSGGSPAETNFPKPQDIARIDAASGGGTISVTVTPRICAVDFTGCPATTWTLTAATTLYGSVTLTSNVTLSGTGAITHAGRSGSYTITSAGKTWANGWTITAIGSTITQVDAFVSTSNFTLTNGTWAAAGQNLTALGFFSSGSVARTINMGSGTWTITRSAAGGAWSASASLVIVSGTSTIVLSDTGSNAKTFDGASLIYNNLTITGGGAGSWTFTGNNTFNVVTIGAPKNVIFTPGSVTTVTKLVAVGTAPNPIVLNSTGAFATISCGNAHGIVCDYLNISNNHGVGGAVFSAGANSTLVVDYTGWVVQAPRIGRWWGQLAISSYAIPADDINAIVGAINVEVTQAPTIGRNFCTSVGLPYTYSMQTWFCNGAPNNAWGLDGDVAHRDDGGVGTSIYKKIAGAWTAIA